MRFQMCMYNLLLLLETEGGSELQRRRKAKESKSTQAVTTQGSALCTKPNGVREQSCRSQTDSVSG